MVTAIIHDQQPTVFNNTFSCYTRLRHEIQPTGLDYGAKWVPAAEDIDADQQCRSCIRSWDERIGRRGGVSS